MASQTVALFALLMVAQSVGEEVTPVQKVIQLLEGMVEKGTDEKQAEQVQFAKFKTFCDATIKSKHTAIEDANEMIALLTANIQKFAAQAEKLGREIAGHDADLSTWKGDLSAATKVRDIERTTYLASAKDYEESIEAVDEGIATIKAQQKDVKQSAAVLAQLKGSSVISPRAQQVLDVYLRSTGAAAGAATPPSLLAVGAPEARAYESATGGVTDMLTELGGKFEKEKKELDTEETEAKHAFEKLAMDLRQQLDSAAAARSEKAAAKARALQAAADARGGRADATGTRDADEQYVGDLSATCEEKAMDFANRQQLRAEEIAAVQKAIEILGSGAVAGAAEKNLPQFVQRGHAQSLAQLRAAVLNPSQLKVAAYLKTQAVKINSRVLAALASRVSADPFKKVKKW